MHTKNNQIVQVTNTVKWIGILDYDIKVFDIVMETKYGTTYNSYYIDAQKKVIVETAKAKFKDAYLEKVKQVTNPEEIAYIVANHTEPDHSGSLEHLIQIAPQAIVVGSGNAIRYLKEMIPFEFKHQIVKDGDKLDLGNKTLSFISAPNLHWPDSIYTYLEEEGVLFTCDSFGAHFCDKNIFDDKITDKQGYNDAFKYYFDVILKPYSKFMLKAIEKIKDFNITTIATGHGPVLRSTWQQAIEKSKEISQQYLNETQPDKKTILIAYVSAYGYTKQMAENIAYGIQLANNNIVIDFADIEAIELGELDSKVTHCSGIALGCPTFNQNILLPAYKVFALINPIRDKGKPALAFGSYGWSGEGIKIIETQFKNLKLNVIENNTAIKFYPYKGKDMALIDLGKKMAENL